METAEKNPVLKRTERGWAGHFICAAACLFRRNTLLEYEDIKIVVSTVGNMNANLNMVKIETIGHERYFETMAFHAAKSKDGFIDADVSRQIDFDSDWCISEPWKEGEANEMHENVVAEIAGRLIDGEKFEINEHESA